MKTSDGTQDATQPGPGDAVAAGTAAMTVTEAGAVAADAANRCRTSRTSSTSSPRSPGSYARRTTFPAACRTRTGPSQPGALASRLR